MNILSLFDGISCGRVALERAGVPVDMYYASEIDKYAIQVAQKNYPDTIQLGDVTQIDFTQYRGKIDLIIGGSPCQGFSFAGKQLNFEDPRSKLFFEFVRAVREIKPRYFLLENVKMKQEFQDIISEQLGVQPIEINSALVSAQNRKRLYWTNIPNVCQPTDKGILLKDVIHEFADLDNCDAIPVLYSRKDGIGAIRDKATALCASDYRGLNRNQSQNAVIGGQLAMNMDGGSNTKSMFYHRLEKYMVPLNKALQILDNEVKHGKIGYLNQGNQANHIYSIHGKTVCLRYHTSGGTTTDHQYLFGCLTPDRINKRQNGQRFNDGNKFYTLTAQDLHGVLVNGYIRKLTPIECERLQTLPDNYTAGISDTQRYKALVNGWTVDVIAHIFKGLTNQGENKMICPFCGEVLDFIYDEEGRPDSKHFQCESISCPIGLESVPECVLDRISALQKKLDKAMAFLKGFERAEQFGALAQEFRDIIKEIEDIKEGNNETNTTNTI